MTAGTAVPTPPVAPGRSRHQTLAAMRVGQHVIAVALTAIGAARAILDGTGAASALIAAIAILLWYGAGVILVPRSPRPGIAQWWVLGLAVVWAVAVALSPEFIWVAFLLWLLAGHVLSAWASIGFSLVVFLVVALAPIMHSGTTTYAGFFGPLIGGVFALGISRGYLQLLRDAQEREELVASLTRAHREMAELQEELALSQRESGALDERSRLSRDIHDTIAQGLTSIRLLAIAETERTTDPGAARTLSQVTELAQESLVDVRRIVAALVPAELDGGALSSALARMLERVRAETGITTELHVDDSLPALPTTTEVALLRTAQSALANTRLHSGAQRVVVSLVDADNILRLDIVDNGRGFDLPAWEGSSPERGSHVGLRFMRRRLRELGGGLDIESAPGEGTALSAFLPLSPMIQETP